MQRRSGHADKVATDTTIDHPLLRQASQLRVHHEHADAGGEENNVLAGLVEIAIEVMLVVHCHHGVDRFQKIAFRRRRRVASESS